jgi:DNA-binding MarR family transcriptional regulator
MDENSTHIEHILQLMQHIADDVDRLRPPDIDDPWLSNSLTMPQFKTMLLIVQSLPYGTTVGSLAKSVGVGFPTMSGIIDRLYEQHLLTRYEDPSDRRVTRILPTEEGQQLVIALRHAGIANWLRILQQLDQQALVTVEKAFQAMLEGIQRLDPQ